MIDSMNTDPKSLILQYDGHQTERFRVASSSTSSTVQVHFYEFSSKKVRVLGRHST